jgi:hypothetical protein
MNRNQAEQLRRRLENGDSFEEVAHSSSVEPGSLVRGGDIGYVTSGEMPNRIEKMVRELEVGEWGGPVFSGAGYYLVQLTELRSRERQPFEEVRDQLSEILRIRKERALVTDFVRRLKARSRLQHVGSSFTVLAEQWQNRTTDELLESRGDLRRLGFSNEELVLPLVQYDGGAYTIQDFFNDLIEAPSIERPPSTNDPLLKLYVEDRVVERLVIESSGRKGIAEDPEVAQRIEAEEGSYLINQIYERVIVPSATVSDEEMESLRGEDSGQEGSDQVGHGTLHDRALQFYEEKRQNTLKDLLVRLRLQTPPEIHEDVLSRVPWPVPPKEKA